MKRIVVVLCAVCLVGASVAAQKAGEKPRRIVNMRTLQDQVDALVARLDAVEAEADELKKRVARLERPSMFEEEGEDEGDPKAKPQAKRPKADPDRIAKAEREGRIVVGMTEEQVNEIYDRMSGDKSSRGEEYLLGDGTVVKRHVWTFQLGRTVTAENGIVISVR